MDATRGRRFHLAILDEACLVVNLAEIWQAAVRPTLTDFRGSAYFLSTPRGQDYFKELFARGQDPLYTEYASWQLPTLTNPYIDPSEIEAARRELPDRIFAQEYLAEFLVSSGAAILGVNEAATGMYIDEPVPGHSYYGGYDLALKNDYCVGIVIQEPCFVAHCNFCKPNQRRMVYMERYGKVESETVYEKAAELARRFKLKRLIVDQTGMGLPMIEGIRNKMAVDTSVEGLVFGNVNKNHLVVQYALAIERQELELLNDTVLKNEHNAYEMKPNERGKVTYSAPVGSHDDTVMAGILAFAACETGRVYYIPDLLQSSAYEETSNVWTFENRGYFNN